MITYQRDPRQQSIPSSAVKIIGLGGAGTNMLEHVAMDGSECAELLALNTDLRNLNACMAGEKIQLGANLTKGLGAGGDPELGYQAMLEAEEEIRASLRGRSIVFLCVGLGGGTGSGAAPVVTRIAREEGAFVVVFATMPFAFEGRRRREQADTALNELAVLSNALVTFDNNRMGELVLAKQGIHEAFAAADRMICESIKAVIRLVVRPGLINVGLDDLMSALRTNRSRCLFGSGLAKGKDRAAAALRNALSSPLLDQGALLKDAETVLVHLCGGEDLTLYEVELMMQRLQKFVPDSAHVLFGAAVDPAMADALSITLISALPEDALAAAPREERKIVDDDIMAPSDSFLAKPEAAAPAPAPSRKPNLKAAAAEIPSLFDDSPFAEAEEAPPQASPDAATALFASAVVAPVEDAPGEETSQAEEDFAGTDVPTGPASATAPEDEDASDDLGEVAMLDEKAEEEFAAPKDSMQVGAFTVPSVTRNITSVLRNLDKEQEARSAKKTFLPPPRWGSAPPQHAKREPAAEPPAPVEAAEAADVPKLKLGVKGQSGSATEELALDSTPRGRFEGQSADLTDGEDLDLPPFLRKKK